MMDPDNASTTHQISVSNPASGMSPGRKWLIRCVVAGFITPILLIAAAPTIVSVFGLQNALLKQATDQQKLSASAESASLGWFRTATLHNARIERDDKTLIINAPSLTTELSLLDVLLNLPDLDTVVLDRPAVVLRPEISGTISGPGDAEDNHSPGHPLQLKTVVREGSVDIVLPSEAEPIVAVNEISFTARTQRSSDTTLLIVEPVKLFDRRRLTPELCGRGLQFIAPVLSESTNVSGELTVDLHEFQMPISKVTDQDRSRLTKISGQIVLHEVETSLRNPVLAQLAAVISTLSGGRVTSIRVAEESLVDFRVENGQIHHEGLTLIVPEVSDNLSLQTSGWVDLEENVDIRILVNLAGLSPSRIPMLANLTQTPIELHMTGTLQQPKIKLPGGRNLLDELAGRLTGGDPASQAGRKPNLSGAISNLVEGFVREPQKKPDVEKTTRGIFDLIQAIQNDQKKPESE